jgi:hypothetical protein
LREAAGQTHPSVSHQHDHPACLSQSIIKPHAFFIMKPPFHLALLLLVAINSPLTANDKLDQAKKLVERIIEAQPPRVTESTRTPEQAIKEYKESGAAPGSRSLKINPVPPP